LNKVIFQKKTPPPFFNAVIQVIDLVDDCVVAKEIWPEKSTWQFHVDELGRDWTELSEEEWFLFQLENVEY
jgi:hypothetical protein